MHSKQHIQIPYHASLQWLDHISFFTSSLLLSVKDRSPVLDCQPSVSALAGANFKTENVSPRNRPGPCTLPGPGQGRDERAAVTEDDLMR